MTSCPYFNQQMNHLGCKNTHYNYCDYIEHKNNCHSDSCNPQECPILKFMINQWGIKTLYSLFDGYFNKGYNEKGDDFFSNKTDR